jgi:hypothetical protein
LREHGLTGWRGKLKVREENGPGRPLPRRGAVPAFGGRRAPVDAEDLIFAAATAKASG